MGVYGNDVNLSGSVGWRYRNRVSFDSLCLSLVCAYWNFLFVQEMLCACVWVDVPLWWCALLCAGLIWGQPTVTGNHVEILPIIPPYWIPGFPSSPLSHRQINISRIRVPLIFLMRPLQKVQHLLRPKTRTVPDLTLIHWHLSDVLECDVGRSLLPLKGLFFYGISKAYVSDGMKPSWY